MSNPPRYEDPGTCFACGKHNPDGLHLPIRPAAGGVELDYSMPARFSGWRDVVHGGIVSTVLDELMAWACSVRGTNTVTAELVVEGNTEVRPQRRSLARQESGARDSSRRSPRPSMTMRTTRW